MRYLIRPAVCLEELVRALDLLGAQLPQRLPHRDWRFVDLAHRVPADRSIMLVAEDQGRLVGGALAFRPGSLRQPRA